MGSPVLNTSSNLPTSKVTAAAVTGAIVTIVVFLLNVIFHVEVPDAVASLLSLVLMTSAAYIKREKTP
jgi:hypothetical protein